MVIAEINKSILETDIQYIAHGVNCQNVMGAGIAKAIYTKYPEVKSSYHKFENKKLGSIDRVKTHKGNVVFNLFTQEFYGRDGKLYVSYKAIEDCFTRLIYRTNAIAIPKIGCGLAGGDWDKVKSIIDKVTGSDLDVYVYYI